MEPTMPFYQKIARYLFGIILTLMACTSTHSITPTIAPTSPTSSAVPVPTVTPRSPATSIFQDCPVQEQEKALRPNQAVQWQQLGLSACYQLELSLDETSQTQSGHETLTYTNSTGNTLDYLVFRIYPNAQLNYNGKLTIQTASIDGQAARYETFLDDQTGLRVLLNSPLQPEKTIRVDLSFSIVLPEDMGARTAYGIFNRSSKGPVLTLANWFPILAVWQDGQWQASRVLFAGDAVTSASALFRVAITAPTRTKVVTTGTQIKETSQNYQSRQVFVSGPARDFMVVASPAFETQTTPHNGVSITQWGLPTTRPGWDYALNYATTSIDFFDANYGAYPFNEYDIIADPLQNASGVEYPGLILISANAYQAQQSQGFLQVVIAHETAHQWWYSVIGNDVLKNPWQDEGLTTFSTLAYLQKYAQPIYQQFLVDYSGRVSETEKEMGGLPIASPLSAFQNKPSAYSPIVYQKSALFFNALRQKIGDEAFQKALKSYYEKNRFQLISPQALLDSFSTACGCDLSELYQKWGAEKPASP